MNKLLRPTEMAKDNMEAESLEAIADKGYESSKDIEACLINGIVSNVGFIQDREQRVFVVENKTKEIPEQKRCSTKSEDIQECLRASVLPKRYGDTSISLEVKHQNAISCFIRHEDGHVIRPWARSYAFKNTKSTETAARKSVVPVPIATPIVNALNSEIRFRRPLCSSYYIWQLPSRLAANPKHRPANEQLCLC